MFNSDSDTSHSNPRAIASSAVVKQRLEVILWNKRPMVRPRAQASAREWIAIRLESGFIVIQYDAWPKRSKIGVTLDGREME